MPLFLVIIFIFRVLEMTFAIFNIPKVNVSCKFFNSYFIRITYFLKNHFKHKPGRLSNDVDDIRDGKNLSILKDVLRPCELFEIFSIFKLSNGYNNIRDMIEEAQKREEKLKKWASSCKRPKIQLYNDDDDEAKHKNAITLYFIINCCCFANDND